ncbi:MAG: 50S ribosomal protein L23 [Candidatus Cloacimonadales bacterium]
MREFRNIVIAPIVTEKTSEANEANNCYTFKVSINANKIEIKKAIEKIFDVKVIRVNTIRQRGKIKRMGRYAGKRADWKKAIVKLADGNSIAEFEL